MSSKSSAARRSTLRPAVTMYPTLRPARLVAGNARPPPGQKRSAPGLRRAPAGGKNDQPLPQTPPQLVNRVQMRPGGPSAAFPAGHQDDLVILVGAGLGVHRLRQVLIADEGAGLAAECLA